MSIKPVAMLTVDEMECLKEGGTAIVIPMGKMLEDDDCIPLYAIPDTHRAVSVEDLKNVADKLDFWINRDDTRSMSESEYKSWLALGHQSKTVTRLRAIIDNK